MKRLVCAALCALSLVTACSKQTVVDKEGSGSSPTSPSPPVTIQATDVYVSAPSGAATLGQCPMYVEVSALIQPDTISDKRVTWQPVTGSTPDWFSGNDDAATGVIAVSKAGIYVMSAKSQQNPNATMHPFSLTISGACTGTNPNPPPVPPPNPPGGGDTFAIAIQPHGGSGQVGSTQTISAVCTKNGATTPCNPVWTTQYRDRVDIIGPTQASVTTIKYISAFSSVITATWNEGNGVSDSATFTGTTAPTPPITVSPLELTLYPPTCPSAGPSTGTLTANMAAKWTTSASNVASVPPQGEATTTVTVTAVGPGTAVITATGPQGQTATATVTVRSCPTNPQNPTCDISVSQVATTNALLYAVTWSVTNGVSASASSSPNVWSGAKALSGTENVTLSAGTTSFTINGTGVAGTTPCSKSVSVTVNLPDLTCSLTASPNQVSQGAHSILTWNTNGVGITGITEITGELGTSGNRDIIMGTTSKTFVVRCRRSDGLTKDASATVIVTTPACPSSIDYNPHGGTVNKGSTFSLVVPNWDTNAYSCVPYWYSGDPSRIQILGGDQIWTAPDGTRYFAGVNGQGKAIAVGSTPLSVQTSIAINSVSKSYTWSVVAGAALQALGVKMPDPPLPRYNIYNTTGVCQTLGCK